MPLTAKGEEIMAAMKQQYGAEEGERVFYASRNAGKITGVDTDPMAAADDGHRTLDPNLLFKADLLLDKLQQINNSLNRRV